MHFLAEELNHSVSNEYDLVEMLNTIDVQLLLKKTYGSIFSNKKGSKVISRRWTPVIEGTIFFRTFVHLLIDS